MKLKYSVRGALTALALLVSQGHGSREIFNELNQEAPQEVLFEMAFPVDTGPSRRKLDCGPCLPKDAIPEEYQIIERGINPSFVITNIRPGNQGKEINNRSRKNTRKSKTYKKKQYTNQWQYTHIALLGNIRKKAFSTSDGLEARYNPKSVIIAGSARKRMEEAIFANYCRLRCPYSNIREVFIYRPIHELPDRTFMNCRKIQYVYLPYTLESIGEATFSGCGLEEFHIPPRVDHIGYGAFHDCFNALKVDLSFTDVSEQIQRMKGITREERVNLFIRYIIGSPQGPMIKNNCLFLLPGGDDNWIWDQTTQSCLHLLTEEEEIIEEQIAIIPLLEDGEEAIIARPLIDEIQDALAAEEEEEEEEGIQIEV